MNSDVVWRGVVVVGCAYEIAALTTQKVPTISTLILTASEHKVGRVAAWMFVGGWAYHFLVRPPSPFPIQGVAGEVT